MIFSLRGMKNNIYIPYQKVNRRRGNSQRYHDQHILGLITTKKAVVSWHPSKTHYNNEWQIKQKHKMLSKVVFTKFVFARKKLGKLMPMENHALAHPYLLRRRHISYCTKFGEFLGSIENWYLLNSARIASKGFRIRSTASRSSRSSRKLCAFITIIWPVFQSSCSPWIFSERNFLN